VLGAALSQNIMEREALAERSMLTLG